MGIIRKQALRNTVLNFVGAGFGSISRLSMPVVLTDMQIGFLTLLDAVSGVFVTIFALGFEQVLAKIFPKYRDEENGHHGFLMLGIFLSLIGIGLASIFYYFLSDLFIPNNQYAEVKSFFLFIFPLIFFRILFRNLDGYAGMLMNTVLGSFLDGLVSKLMLLLGLIGFALSFLNFEHLTIIFVSSICLPGLVITIYSLFKTKKIILPSKEFYKPEIRKDILSYIGFGILMGASTSIVYYVDSLMVNKYVSLDALGIYATYFFAARIMLIPVRSLAKISTVILAESWKNKDEANVLDVYKKSCLNQMLIGAFMLGLGWMCLEPALVFLPDAKYQLYHDNLIVFLFLGVGILVEMSTGVNVAVIATSDKYKFNTYFNLTLAVLVIILNYFLIMEFEIIGAAIATMLAMIIVNFMRWLFLFRSFKLQPFDSKFIKAAAFAAIYLVFAYFIDYEARPIPKLIINGVVATFVYGIAVIALKLSPDFDELFQKFFKKKS